MFTEVLTLILALALVIIIIFATYYGARWFQKNIGAVHNGKYMKVIDRTMLGREQYIALVEVQETVYLIGVTANQITLLEKLEGNEFTEQDIEQERNEFANRFQSLIQQQLKNKQR